MSNKNKNKHGIIFSTNPEYKYVGSQSEVETLAPEKQNLRIWIEKNHRGGKEATVIKNFIGITEDLEKLCKEIKQKCGTGGSVKDGEMIIQGDQRKKIGEMLTKLGYKFKLAGG